MINTTRGAMPRPGERVGHTLNTSRVVEEDLIYEDEEPEIAHVLTATGWVATFEDGHREPLVFWVVDDSGEVYGIVLVNGRPDLAEGNAEKLSGFVRYEQANNDMKEK